MTITKTHALPLAHRSIAMFAHFDVRPRRRAALGGPMLGALTSRGLALGGLALGSLACSSDGVDLGGGVLTRELTRGVRCMETAIVEGDVRVTSQEELAALEGCEEIRGELSIQLFAEADLSPLHALRVVEATLVLGSSALDTLSSEQYGDPEWQAIEEREAPLRGVWLGSLTGLESLEIIGGLLVGDTAITDLAPLARLRQVGGSNGSSAGLSAGEIYLFRNALLRDLAGLDGASGVERLQLAFNTSLESLDGFRAPPTLDILNIIGSPALVDIEALRPLTSSNVVVLDDTGLRDLDGLSGLAIAGDSLSVENNSALADASALGNLEQTRSVLFSNNAVLKALPSFHNYQFVPDIIYIRDNPELEQLDIDMQLTTPLGLEVGGEFHGLSMDVINIGNNAKLRSLIFAPSLTGVFGLHSAQIFLLDQNPSLLHLDFGSLERADVLSIDQNPVLDEVILGALSRVDRLAITNNPSLDASVFDRVQTFDRVSTGNANDAPP